MGERSPRGSPHAHFCVATCLVAASFRVLAQTAPSLQYYDSAIGATGAALKAALHDIIDGHTVLPYTAVATDTWDALKVLDEDPANPAKRPPHLFRI